MSPINKSLKNKKALDFSKALCGLDETRTRDPMRDRQVVLFVNIHRGSIKISLLVGVLDCVSQHSQNQNLNISTAKSAKVLVRCIIFSFVHLSLSFNSSFKKSPFLNPMNFPSLVLFCFSLNERLLKVAL